MAIRLYPWGCFGLALLFFAQGFFGSLEKSLTWDEPIYIASGTTYLTRGDFRLTPETPPLMQMAVALPVLALRPDLPPEADPAWREGNHVRFAQRFVAMNSDRLRQIAIRARMPVLLLGAGLVFSVGLWGRRLYGPVPALAAAAAASVSPNLLAHAKLATTDLGCAALMFFAVASFQRAERTGRARSWVLCGGVSGLALLTKFTALLLLPVFLLLALIAIVRKPSVARSSMLGLALVAGVALVVVGIGYGPSFDYGRYVDGVNSVYSTARPGYVYYLFGQLSEEPWPHYNLAAMAVKLPVASLALISFGLASLVASPRRREPAVYLLLPALIVLGASLFDRANIGVRHVLPAFPFLLLFGAHGLAVERRRWRHWLVGLLLLWLGIQAARIYPHHLAFFNVAAGGPENGPYLLDDSNIDWGQDLPALAGWQRAHPEAGPLRLAYFGNVPPEAYGVEAGPMSRQDIVDPQPGTYAVSAHQLVWFRKLGRRTGAGHDWLTRYRPIDRAGYSIYIYSMRADDP